MWSDSHYWIRIIGYPVDITLDSKATKLNPLFKNFNCMGLGTSKEIYEVLVPPLSHVNKLPHEAVAAWYN